MREICFLAGRIVPLAEARLDPLDRGFIYGDALYEWVKVLRGVPLLLEAHLERLRGGLVRIDIDAPTDLERLCRELIQASGLGTGYLYLQVSRGAGPRVYLPSRDTQPTLFILPREHEFFPVAGAPRRAVTSPDRRWLHCDLKTTSMMATVVGKLQARDAGVDEILWVSPEGELREGGNTNLFVRRGNVMETHPLDGRILAGITRHTVLDLAAAEGLDVVERAPRLDQRDAWREAFLTGTHTGVQPLVEVDGRPVAGGETGPWTRRLARLYADYEEELVRRAGAGEAPPPQP